MTDFGAYGAVDPESLQRIEWRLVSGSSYVRASVPARYMKLHFFLLLRKDSRISGSRDASDALQLKWEP